MFNRQPTETLTPLLEKIFYNKIKRGMRVRVLDGNNILLEDIDEWLHNDSEELSRAYKAPFYMDFYGVSSYESSMTGFSICIHTVPVSLLWKCLGIILAVMNCVFLLGVVHVFFKNYEETQWSTNETCSFFS